ncbi:hypothetical protein RSAG8_12617, partial [Rhizoctonia solani AG-8 WAC10335]
LRGLSNDDPPAPPLLRPSVNLMLLNGYPRPITRIGHSIKLTTQAGKGPSCTYHNLRIYCVATLPKMLFNYVAIHVASCLHIASR